MEFDKVYLGNCYELIKDIPDKSIDLIITDPPYDIKGLHGSGIIKDRDISFHKELEENNLGDGIDLSILHEFVRIQKKINIYIFCNKEQIIPYLDFFVKEKGCNYEVLIFAKKDPVPFCGTHYLKDKEYCLYFWEKGAYLYVPYERGKTVFLSKRNTDDKDSYGHPTIKPLEFILTLVKNSSLEGGVVFDAFIGSGTTAVAAKQLQRHYLGFEINETYFKIAKDRLNGINKQGQTNLFETDFEELQEQYDLFKEENK